MSTPISTPTTGTASALHVYVDSIESGIVKLLLRDDRDDRGEWRGHNLPATVLPPGTREGAWLRLSLEPSEPPASVNSETLRRDLSKTDSGGDFSL